ncbi:MAG: hypothetical protein IT385_17145 [Deltaproteobacteria bacterium]|nr:hypothetical protein [Deltaproteobacteria bacterium]
MTDPAEPNAKTSDLATLVGRSKLPAELARAPGMKKLDWILGQPDPEAFVRALAPQELYYWMRDIGKGDSGALLELADREQKRALVDIDAWSRHELELPRWLDWLDLAQSASDDTALDFVAAQDDETLEWLFSGDVQVYAADADLDAVPDELAAFRSPDGAYLVTVPREHELEDRLPRLMKLLWAADEDRARLIFQQLQFDLRANITEDMERFRNARVQDMGFEPMTDALEVWATVPVAALRDAARRGAPPTSEDAVWRGPPDQTGLVHDLVLTGIAAPDLLARALAGLAPDDRVRAGEGLAYLVNKVFVAETGDLSRLDDLPIIGRHAAALVNLGLEHLADEDEERATHLLATTPAEVLFRAGHTLTLEVGKRARAVRTRTGAARGLALFGTPVDEALHGASLLHPLYFEGLDEPGALGHRAFATLADLAKVEVRVADAQAVTGFFEARFGFTPAALEGLAATVGGDQLARVRFTTLLRTAMAWTLLKDEAAFAPLGRDELAAFARAAFERTPGGGVRLAPPLARLVDDVGQAAGSEPGSEAIRAFVDRALGELLDAIGGVAPADVDPRFTADLFLVSGD